MSHTHSETPRATSREWIGMAVLVLPALLASMDLSILFIAVPWVSADLEPSATQQLWIMDVYGFVLAGLLITMGSIGDRIGRRRMLLIGAVAFGAASLLAAFSTSAEMLIAARVVLGIGAAMLAPSTLSLLRGMFQDENQRRTAVGIWTTAFAGGPAIGPIIGGMLLEHFHWGSVFLINIPIMVVLLIAAPLLLPESRDPMPGTFDAVGPVLSLAAILPIIYGLKKVVESGFDAFYLGFIGLGVIFAILFVRRQLTSSAPMIDVRLFRRASFSASIMAFMAVIFAVGGMGLMTVTFLQTVMGYGPLHAAVWMLPTVAGSFIGVAAASFLGRTVRPAVLVSAGLIFVSGGFFWVSTIGPDSHVASLIFGYVLLNVGVGLTSTVATSLVLTTAPPEKAGAASAISETSAEFGGALGIAALGTLASAVYRNRMQGEVPEAVGDAGVQAAEDTVGGAAAVAEEAPADLADPLLAQAFEAYSQGFNMAATAGGALALGVAILAGVVLRKVAAGSTQDSGETGSDH